MSKNKIQVQVPKTRKEFVEFFDNIPEKKWCTGTFTAGEKHCAVGHVNAYINNTLKNQGVEDSYVKLNPLFRKVKNRFEKNFNKVYGREHGLYELIDVNDNSHDYYNSKKLKVKGPKKRVLAFLTKAK